jgi:hypothetical protein
MRTKFWAKEFNAKAEKREDRLDRMPECSESNSPAFGKFSQKGQAACFHAAFSDPAFPVVFSCDQA